MGMVTHYASLGVDGGSFDRCNGVGGLALHTKHCSLVLLHRMDHPRCYPWGCAVAPSLWRNAGGRTEEATQLCTLLHDVRVLFPAGTRVGCPGGPPARRCGARS